MSRQSCLARFWSVLQLCPIFTVGQSAPDIRSFFDLQIIVFYSVLLKLSPNLDMLKYNFCYYKNNSYSCKCTYLLTVVTFFMKNFRSQINEQKHTFLTIFDTTFQFVWWKISVDLCPRLLCSMMLNVYITVKNIYSRAI